MVEIWKGIAHLVAERDRHQGNDASSPSLAPLVCAIDNRDYQRG